MSPDNGNGVFWYSFDYGLVHVIQFSSEHDFRPGSRQVSVQFSSEHDFRPASRQVSLHVGDYDNVELCYLLTSEVRPDIWISILPSCLNFSFLSSLHLRIVSANLLQSSKRCYILQFLWIEKDLKSVDRKKTPWIVVTSHRPLYASQVLR